MDKEVGKAPRWYFGGISCSIAACCTHPLDMMKVHLQTHTSAQKLSIFGSLITVAKSRGVLSLYNGLSASVSRESVYSGFRFAVFDMLRPHPGQEAHSFLMKVLTAAGAGAAGGFVGAPLDLVNVRMLNDVKAGATTARRYKHVFDGLVRICREEHPQNLYNGATMVVIRAICITVGQLSFYHQVKETLLGFDWFEDTIPTHLLCSAVAVGQRKFLLNFTRKFKKRICILPSNCRRVRQQR
ncbi:hypothetical protein RvY_14695-1 [Ramazzottius varieornatus]|uniref:Mitochondrial dicarboxylate carrier n=1 Tax=Ramazzottius varieornatus TaxID=947166 RepID=A0A1D1VS90_RAMVA|nr:hypothetical protein RvY_14695-1 [Ramazzottius varieornatus]